MRLKKTVLALAATAALAVPAAAFAQDWGSHDGRYDGRGYEQTREGRGYEQTREGRGYWDRGQGERRYGRPMVCRRGVFYMRGTWCATRGRVSHDRYDRRDQRFNEHNGYSDRRW